MNFDDFYRQLNREERIAFAKRATTSPDYIEIHLLRPLNPRAKITKRKTPTKQTMEKLAKASRGKVTYVEVMNYFYLPP
jgi:hypothetical protein